MDCRAFAVGFVLSTAGCFVDTQPSVDDDAGSTEGATSEPASGGTVAETTGEFDPSGGGSSSGGVVPTTGGSSTTTGTCETLEIPVPVAPVDIVMVLDSSSAMLDNAQDVQTALDGVSQVFPENTQHRFILMSPLDTDNNVDFCMPPPLGASVCGVDRFPHFTHVDVDTRQATADPLGEMIAALGQGVPSVRAASQKHLIVVTDGDVQASPKALAAALWDLGLDFLYARVHGVSGGGSGGCEPDPQLDAVVELLGGQSIDLCPLNGAAEFFGSLIQPTPSCVVELNVEGDIDRGTLITENREFDLTYVESLEGCSQDPTATIIADSLVLCPQTCRDFQDAVGAASAELELVVCP